MDNPGHPYIGNLDIMCAMQCCHLYTFIYFIVLCIHFYGPVITCHLNNHFIYIIEGKFDIMYWKCMQCNVVILLVSLIQVTMSTDFTKIEKLGCH